MMQSDESAARVGQDEESRGRRLEGRSVLGLVEHRDDLHAADRLRTGRVVVEDGEDAAGGPGAHGGADLTRLHGPIRPAKIRIVKTSSNQPSSSTYSISIWRVWEMC